MRITAITAYVPQRAAAHAAASVPEPRRAVTVTPSAPIEAGMLAAAMLSGRGMIVDIVC